jgi:hypothetical protein
MSELNYNVKCPSPTVQINCSLKEVYSKINNSSEINDKLRNYDIKLACKGYLLYRIHKKKPN